MNSSPHIATTLWLIRHGETAQSSRGRCYGSLDVALSAAGIVQVQAAAQRLGTQRLSGIHCSPRTRCRDSAEIIAAEQTCTVETVEDLAELYFGDFEGRTYHEIAAEHPKLYAEWMANPTKVRFPGGESFSDMWTRVNAAVRKLRAAHAGSSFAIVAHGGVNRIILAEALGLPAENIFRIGQGYAALNLVKYYGDATVVELMNDSARVT
jgi:alpha-ribazole phosphatase/probable phosphoglycerate mutase